MDKARHHVLGDARAGVAVDDDGRLLVHAGAVVADVAVDLDGDRRVEAGGDGVLAARVVDAPVALVGVGRERWRAALSSRSGVSARSTSASQRVPRNRRCAGSGSQTLALSMPGRTASARYSEPKAT